MLVDSVPVRTYFVPKSFHARIVGPKGAYINELRAISGGPVGLHDDGSVVMFVSREAEMKLTELLGIPPLNPPPTIVHEPFPASSAGSIIGKKFSRLNEIMSQSNTFIEVQDSPCGATIYGQTIDACNVAVAIIRSICSYATPGLAQARAAASSTADARGALFQQSRVAYEMGDKHLAKVLSTQAAALSSQISACNDVARDAVIQRELSKRCLETGVLDVHGLHSKEAVEAATEFIRRRPGVKSTIVIGRGSHSVGGGTIRPAVLAALAAMPERPLVDTRSDIGAINVYFR